MENLKSKSNSKISMPSIAQLEHERNAKRIADIQKMHKSGGKRKKSRSRRRRVSRKSKSKSRRRH